MITNKNTAIQISALMIELNDKLDDSVALVQDTCEEEQLKKYRRAVGQLMGTIFLDIMTPLYQTHPDLKPAGLP